MKNDRYFISILDYMIVGDDDSSTIDDKPRPKGRRLSLFLRSVFLKIFAKKVFEWGSWWKLATVVHPPAP